MVQQHVRDVKTPFPISSSITVFEIVSDCLRPRYDLGDIILCGKPTNIIKTGHEVEAIVQLADGQWLLTKIMYCGNDQFDLINPDETRVSNAKISLTYKICGSIRANEWESYLRLVFKKQNLETYARI